ncbi:DUF397 domain-containing protein [Actinomadura rugatobispora]|uniref:DUF397 domain-containing protein n=1 Tax=Actinomadura rugatobispora TaxID=1994 RepID=A0ABW1A4L0_9ACTN|nr:hypothetical protein GCM10010200_055430 [Actinomadura rugatobispora]
MRPDRAIPFHWRRSLRCQSNNGCVEVAPAAGADAGPDGPAVVIRDGAAPGDDTFLFLTPAAWRAFVTRVKTS